MDKTSATTSNCSILLRLLDITLAIFSCREILGHVEEVENILGETSTYFLVIKGSNHIKRCFVVASPLVHLDHIKVIQAGTFGSHQGCSIRNYLCSETSIYKVLSVTVWVDGRTYTARS